MPSCCGMGPSYCLRPQLLLEDFSTKSKVLSGGGGGDQGKDFVNIGAENATCVDG